MEDGARRRLRLEPVVLDDGGIGRAEERAAAGALELEAALAAWPAATREALLARVVEEQEYEEVAGRLRCSEQVARQRVSRGLRALRTTSEEQR